MAEQSVSIKSAQDSQRDAIAKAKAQQEANLMKSKQIAEEAKRRADEMRR